MCVCVCSIPCNQPNQLNLKLLVPPQHPVLFSPGQSSERTDSRSGQFLRTAWFSGPKARLPEHPLGRRVFFEGTPLPPFFGGKGKPKAKPPMLGGHTHVAFAVQTCRDENQLEKLLEKPNTHGCSGPEPNARMRPSLIWTISQFYQLLALRRPKLKRKHKFSPRNPATRFRMHSEVSSCSRPENKWQTSCQPWNFGPTMSI